VQQIYRQRNKGLPEGKFKGLCRKKMTNV
jgi:hypothetical protein